ncbi:MAG TPA: cation transporter [bacterium]|nr:cation transporter [bacterium]
MNESSSLKRNWLRLALWLVGGTLVYNTIEAGVAIYAGVNARSIALIGFGLDSIIEFAAALMLLWRLAVEARGADRERVETTERQVRRFVGLTFFALAAYVIGQAGFNLWVSQAPEESLLGIVLAAVSLVVMPLVSWGKLRAARAIGSAALRAEAKETLACSYLSFTLLLGLGLHAWIGWWWADPLAALLMAPWLIKEGFEGFEVEEEDDD